MNSQLNKQVKKSKILNVVGLNVAVSKERKYKNGANSEKYHTPPFSSSEINLKGYIWKSNIFELN